MSTPKRRLPWWVRWLHTYVSMLGFLSLLFFAVTGITLNHAEAFEAGGETTAEFEGEVSPEWVAGDVDKLAVAEHLRAQHGLIGTVHDFVSDDYECTVIFKGPGYAADAIIDRESGEYSVLELRKGTMALFNDLHKGRDSGPGWSWFIDISAGVLAIAGLTGLWLLFYIKKRRQLGLWVALLGTLAPAAVYWLAVP